MIDVYKRQLESHEGVRQLVIELALDVLVVDVLRDGVVDVQQGDSIACLLYTS